MSTLEVNDTTNTETALFVVLFNSGQQRKFHTSYKAAQEGLKALAERSQQKLYMHVDKEYLFTLIVAQIAGAWIELSPQQPPEPSDDTSPEEGPTPNDNTEVFEEV